MVTTEQPRGRLSTEELETLLALVKGADSVELKLTVPETDQRSAVASLGLDPLEAQIRQVFFYDTPDLTLNKAGVVVRSRRIQGREGDSVIKLRPVVPDDLSADLRATPGFNVEVDAMPGGFVCSATLKRLIDVNDPREVAAGDRKIRKLFSKAQRAFFAEHAPDGLTMDNLSILGPITVFKLKFAPAGFARKMVAELWMYPDNSRILELSTKCLPAQAFQVATEARVFLSKHGVNMEGDQQTKTKTALEFFSSHLAAAPAEAAPAPPSAPAPAPVEEPA